MFKKKLIYFCLCVLIFIFSCMFAFGQEGTQYEKIPIVPASEWKIVEFLKFESSLFDNYDLYSEKYFIFAFGDLYFTGFNKLKGTTERICFEVKKVIEVEETWGGKSNFVYYVYFNDEEYGLIIEPKYDDVFYFNFMKKQKVDKEEKYVLCFKFTGVKE